MKNRGAPPRPGEMGEALGRIMEGYKNQISGREFRQGLRGQGPGPLVRGLTRRPRWGGGVKAPQGGAPPPHFYSRRLS